MNRVTIEQLQKMRETEDHVEALQDRRRAGIGVAHQHHVGELAEEEPQATKD